MRFNDLPGNSPRVSGQEAAGLSYPEPTADQRAVAVHRLERGLSEGDLRAICEFAWVRPDIETLIRQVFPWLEALSEDDLKRECSYVLGLVTAEGPVTPEALGTSVRQARR